MPLSFCPLCQQTVNGVFVEIVFAFIAFLVFIFVFSFFVSSLSKKSSSPSGDWPFYPKRPLSKVEQILYFRMIEALPDLVILPQVQLSRFMGVKKGFKFNEWNNRINRKSVDFLVCTKSFDIIAAVELDDSTHTRPDRVKADSDKDKAIRDAGLKIIRWHVSSLPDSLTIQSSFISNEPVFVHDSHRLEPKLDIV